MRATIPGSLEKEMSALAGEILWCAGLAANPERRAAREPSVSSWAVSEQLEHLLRADRGILARLREAASGSAEPGTGRPSATGMWVLLSGTIPRGRGTAPDGTRPEGMPAGALVSGWAALVQTGRELQGRVAEIRASPGRWAHPLLGTFGPWQWARFAHVHHRHHRAIIEDILAGTGK